MRQGTNGDKTIHSLCCSYAAGIGTNMIKRNSHKRLKFTYIKASAFVIFCYFLLFGEFIVFERTGDNYFHLQLNGQEIGTIDDPEETGELLTEARRRIAMEESELVLIDAELTCTGEEVLWGRIDQEDTILDNMTAVLASSVKETMHRSYTVKVNEYMVNLSSLEDVNALLQAAVSKYDTENDFSVELCQDTTREFDVLTAEIVSRQELDEQDGTRLFVEAGIQADFTEMIESAEPEVEKGFEDYELGILEMNFSEDVEIVEAYLPESQLKSLEQAIDEVTKEQETVSTYEVVSGDTLSEIALKVNIPMERLIEMNSQTLENENSMIRVGDELIITIPEPELSVSRLEENYIEEIYDADIIYVDNDSWYTNQTKVLQQPSAGFRKIIAISSYVNDKEVSREIVKQEVVMEAVPKIVERGTRIPPTYIKPVSGGRLSSGFGKRSAPTKGASTYHKGVDWAVPIGTAVYASCGGTVAKAGWGSGYGYVVYINHEDGRQTRYAHLSKVLVSVGQSVKQGEKIALSGNTGITSGPHVHFEILINGSQVNPLNYLN